jgi:hypothetical protein
VGQIRSSWYGNRYGNDQDYDYARNEQLEEVRAMVAAGQAASISAFVKHAVGIALHDATGWRELLEDALQQRGGPLTKKERVWADAILSSGGTKRHSRKGKAA